MVIKIIIAIFLLIIFYCLGSALFYMLYNKDSKSMAKALTWRVILSLTIFLLLILGFMMGWISPHGLK